MVKHKKCLFLSLFLLLTLSLQSALPFPEEENELLRESTEEHFLLADEQQEEEASGDLEELIADEGEASLDDSLPIQMDELLARDGSLVVKKGPFSLKRPQVSKLATVNMKEVFAASPMIYSLLLLLSVGSIAIWGYSMMTVRSIELLPPDLIRDLRSKLINNQFDEALDLCVQGNHFFCRMLASGILMRKHGMAVMLDTMKAEGKRATTPFWQRISLLNEIALIAPMLGLLGTVLGLFYAFYDINRSIESVSVLFDGLGISVGTTVAGLIVAIVAMILHGIAKYRLVRTLTNVENEAQTFAALVDVRAPSYLELP